MSKNTREEQVAALEKRLAELKERDPEAYAAAEAGALAFEKRQAEEEAKLRAEFAEKHPFESKISELKATGLSLGQAIAKVAQADPQAHTDFLKRVQAGTASVLR